ncbi:hypothetical protein E4U55_002836 [Claviceps digitariae]|nr:hypothetical protein E4U55_002836 [Claviceps digitariae]
MAGGAMHEGTQAATRGIIFKDMVFWVALRKNGGVVVPLEKDAQVLIADHARKDAPRDSISWKYITDSVAHGFAQLTDRYCILRPADLATSARTKLTRSGFTNAEDAALANWVLSHSKDRTGNQIYKEFAESHPSHPWQSWRNRFVKVLANYPIHKLNKLAMSAADLAVQSRPKFKPDSEEATSESTPRATEKQPSTPSTPRQTPPPAAQRPSPRRNSTISPPSHVSAARPIITSVASAHETQQQLSLSPQDFSSAQSEELGVETQVNMRDRFYHDLAIFVEESGIAVNPDPEVRGKRLELWDLSQAFASQNVPPEEVDWRKVAEDLQYDWRRDPNLVDELRGCFEENLANFFEAISSYVPDDEDVREQEEAESPSSLHSPARVRRSSTPPVASPRRKRGIEYDSVSLGENSAKRRCLGRTAEIPATPEDRLGILSTRSPTLATIRQQQQQQQKQQPKGDEEEEDDDDEEQTHISRGRVSSGRKILSPTDKDDDKMLEDNLPALHAQSTPPFETQQSSIDVTPSQQLRSEASNLEPIPLNLGLPRSVGRPQGINHTEPLQQQQQQQQQSAAKSKTSSRIARRSLPASFNTNSQRFTAQKAEARTQQPSRPSRVAPDEEGQSQSIRECVEYYEGLGYSRSIVMESLNRASLRPGWPATFLMERLKNNEKIPSNVEGIWTDRDDKSLRYADSVRARWATATTPEKDKAKKVLDRLINKHTEEDVDLRRRFFAAQARMG